MRNFNLVSTPILDYSGASMPVLSDFDPADFEVLDDEYGAQFDPGEFDVLSDEEAAKALYKPSREALKLRQQFQREQEQTQDESTWIDRLALGVGQGLSGLESSLGGLFNLAGLTGVGRDFQWDARQRGADLRDVSETLAGQNPDIGREWLEQFGGMATQQIPTVAAAALSAGNPFITAGVAGLQSAGSVQDVAEQAYEAQGLSEDEATSSARLPALVSGGITAALTRMMPGGTERLAGLMFGGPAARQVARQAAFSVAKNIFREAAKEAPEEMLDQLGQAAVARFSYDPEKPLDEILMETWEAGGWGVGTAGTVGALGAGIGAVERAVPRGTSDTGMNLRTPAGATPPVYEDFEVIEEPAFVEEQQAEQTARYLPRRPVPDLGASQPLLQSGDETIPAEFETIDAIPETTRATISETNPALEETRQRLLENMQGRSMDISPDDFARADAHLRGVLGPNSPTWAQLSEAGLIRASLNPTGTVNVRVAPTVSENATVETPAVQSPPAQIAPAPEPTTIEEVPEPTTETGPQFAALTQSVRGLDNKMIPAGTVVKLVRPVGQPEMGGATLGSGLSFEVEFADGTKGGFGSSVLKSVTEKEIGKFFKESKKAQKAAKKTAVVAPVESIAVPVEEPPATVPSPVVPPPAPSKKPKSPATPAGEALSLKGQKEFLVNALDEAISKSSTDRTRTEASRDWEEVRSMKPEDFDKLAKKYNVPQETPETKRKFTSADRTEMDRRNQDAVIEAIRRAALAPENTITIEVPNDGTFTVFNDKQTLTQFRDRVRKQFPSDASLRYREPSMPRTTATPTSSVPNAAKLKPSDKIKIAATLASQDETRPVINYVYEGPKEIISTDGRMMLIIDQPGGPKKAKLHKDGKAIPDGTVLKRTKYKDGKEVNDDITLTYPNWKQVIPAEFKDEIKGVDTAELLATIAKADAAFSKDETAKQASLRLIKNQDGSYGVRASTAEGDTYETNVLPNPQWETALNREFFDTAIKGLRSLGNAKINIRFIDELSPVVLQGKGAKVVLMPMRMSSLASQPPSVPPGEPTPPSTDPIARLRLEKTRIVARALKESPAIRGLNFQLEVTPAREGDPSGLTEMGARIGNFIEAAENADEKTVPHEFSHILFDALPPEVKATIEKARTEAYQDGVRSGRITPNERVAAGQMTSTEFQEAGLPIEMYPMANTSEFLAHLFGDKFSQQALAKADPSLISKLKVWLAEIWRAVKRALNLGNEMDRVVQDLIDGRLQFDPAVAAQNESKVRQATFVMSGARAEEAAKLATTQLQQKIEGESMLAQAADVVDVMDRFGVNTQGSRVQEAFDYRNWSEIRDTGEQLNQGRESYQQMKARHAGDPYRRARLAGEAGQSILRFGQILDQAIVDGQEAFKKLTSTGMQNFIARVQSKAADAQSKAAILQTTKAMFDSASKEAKRALKEEARTDRDVAVLQGEIQQIEEMSQSSVAMEQALNDMVSTLANWPNLFTGQGGSRAIISEYKKRKQAAGQPVQNEGILKWASYILAKSPKLAAQLQASNLAKQTGLRSQLNGMAKQLADDFSKDPVGTVRRAMSNRERQTRSATTAEFAFKQLEEELLEELEPLQAAVDAANIADQIKRNPQFEALRREILNDQTSWGGSDAPAKAMRSKDDAGSTITMPVQPGHPMSGATVGIGHEVLDGNATTLRTRWDEQRRAIEFLKDWLANPLNSDDPMRRYHTHNLDTLENYYGGQQHLMPENQSPLWSRAYSIIGAAVSKSGSRLVGQGRSVLQRADQMHKWSRDWFDNTVHKLPMTQRAAMKSHGIKWNNVFGQSIVQANRIYQRDVGQELAWSWARQQGGYNVGDTLSSGKVVTREDIDHLEAMAKAGFESLELAGKFDQQITEDARGLKKGPNYRSALRTSPYLVPRMFDYTQEDVARKVSDAYMAETTANGSPGPATEAALNAIWTQVGLSMVKDRNAEFAKPTIFDGAGAAFEMVGNMMQQNPDSIPTIDALANELSTLTTLPPDQAKAIVLEEFGRIVDQWSKAVQEKVEAGASGGKSGDAKNSFTQARGDALAPWTFYRTGFTTTDDVANHAAGMQSVAVDRVIATLEAIDKDLDRQTQELERKTAEFERQGKPGARKAAIDFKEQDRRRGQTFDTWQNLSARQGQIRKVLQDLKAPTAVGSDFDMLLNRGAGALVGTLIGNVVTTAKNISSIFLGRQLRAAGMNELQSLLYGMGFTIAEGGKLALSLSYGGVRSLGYVIRGMGLGVPQLLKGNARAAYASVLRDVIRELSANVPRRLKSVREMEALGLYKLPDKVAQFDNQILGSILYRGSIPANEFNGAAKLGGYTAGLFESTILALANAGFPTMGDAAVNGAIWNAVNSSWGPVQGMQDSLQKLFTDWKAGGLPRTFNLADPSDPVNRLSPKELGLTEHTMSQLRRTYQMAGMSFDERAADYLSQLDANPQNPANQFLTEEDRQKLSEALINKMNRASFSNAPLRFKDGTFVSNLVRPLYGWNVRSFADWEQSLAVPTNTETGRMRLWATSMALAFAALAMTGAAGQLKDELVARMLRRGLYSAETQNRLPWEEPTGGRKVASWTRLMMESVPLLGIAGNLLIPANTPARASFEPTLVAFESGKAIADLIHGWFATGDPTYGLANFVSRFVPDSKIVLNRLQSQEGRRLSANAVADIKRFAPPDAVRPPYKGGGVTVTELSPWIQRMENSAMRGDRDGFKRAYREAVQAAQRMKKKEPVDAVRAAWRGRNPETRALKRRLTPTERAEMMRNARGAGRDLSREIDLANQRWRQAGATIGVGTRSSSGPRISLRAPSLARVGRGLARY